MSFGTTDAAPQPKQKLLGIAPQRTSTNEEARPLPLFWGQQRLGITWLDMQRNDQTTPVTVEQQSGKDDAQTVTTGIEYRADLLAIISLGPVDIIKTLWLNGTQAWGTTLNRGSSDDVEFEIPGRGVAKFYFGTDSQNVDFDGDHPDYRLQAVLGIKQFFFGIDTTSAPTIEVEVGRWPSFSWLNNGDSKIGSTCNPIAIIADALTHPLLYNLPSSILDTIQLSTTARTLKSEGIGLSPLITRNQTMDQFLAEVCAYFDGVPRWIGGKLQIQLMRNAPARSTLLTLDESVLTDPPQIDAGDWTQTNNQLRISYTRQDNGYKEASHTWTNEGNKLLTGSLRSQTINRPWVMTESVAVKLASQVGRRISIPAITGRVTAIERIVRKLRCGQFFRLRWTSPEIDLVCRVTERRMDRPDSRTVELIWSAEPSQDGESIDATDPRDTPPARVPVVAARLQLVELPWPLTAGQETIGVLASRGNAVSDRFEVWASPSSSGYQSLLNSRSFTLAGVLGADFPIGPTIDDGPGLLLDLTGSVNKSLASVSLNDSTINRALVFIGGEIMSLREAQLVSAGIYRLKGLIRARFDSPTLPHASGAEIFLIEQTQLCKVVSPLFRPQQAWNFKVQPAAGRNVVDLSTVTPINLTLDFKSLRPPSPVNLRVNGALTGSFARTATLTLSFSQTTWGLADFFNWSFYTDGFDPEVGFVMEIYGGATLFRTFTGSPGTSLSPFAFSSFYFVGPTANVKLWSTWRGYRSARANEITFTIT